MVLVPSPLTAAFSQSCMSPEVSTLVAPEASLGLASEEGAEESDEVVQAARPRAMEPTAAAAKIVRWGALVFLFVGWRGHSALGVCGPRRHDG